MTSRLTLLVLLVVMLTSCASATHSTAADVPAIGFTPVIAPASYTGYVNPFIGTAPSGPDGFEFASGDVFPGAVFPMGMVQWSPDTPSNLPGGYYYPDNTIKGFSLTHFSGRGCRAYQDVPFMPFLGGTSSIATTFSHANEQAHPGYYRVKLDSGITVELATTLHTGVGRFTYPPSTHANLWIDAGGSINGNSGARVRIDTAGRTVTGEATSTVGCGSEPYTLYFAARFDRAFTGFGNGSRVADLVFDTTRQPTVNVQVGISYVSVANAEANLAAERMADVSVARLAADAAWNARLSDIQVAGGTLEDRVNFYTALYHTFIHPNVFSDANGQYLGFDGKVHRVSAGHAQYENIPGWDEYRSLTRLRAILAPNETADIAQSLVNDAQHGDGHLPRWEQTNADSRGMVGDSADVEIASAAAFGATNFDERGALAAMLNGQPLIRQGYSDYVKLGYIPISTQSNAVAVTQEYTNDDFAIAQFAQALGDTSTAKAYLHRAANWRNVFDPATGSMQPRQANGSWDAQNPASAYGFTESDSAQMTWMEPFDLRDLIAAMGGPTVAVSRLDALFTRLNAGRASQYAYMGNEPCEEVPWTYDFAQAPARTQAVTRRIELELFHNRPDGFPGNDDGGSLSSWYVFAAIGLYPDIPGVGGFVIGSPLFTSVTLRLAGGHTLQINAPAAADDHPYVQNMAVDGQTTTSLWLPWSRVQHGATLAFTLGASVSSWGSAPNDGPPSYAG